MLKRFHRVTKGRKNYATFKKFLIAALRQCSASEWVLRHTGENRKGLAIKLKYLSKSTDFQYQFQRVTQKLLQVSRAVSGRLFPSTAH